jgi:sugar lactone lactonase YvrE
MTVLIPIVTGLTFPEGPRWRGDQLWFSDFYSHAVYTVDLAGNCRKVVDVPGQPSGLGCQPDGICLDADGDILVTTMNCNKLVKFAPDGTHRATLEFDVPLWACAVSDTGDILLCTSHHAAKENCQRERSGTIQRVIF